MWPALQLLVLIGADLSALRLPMVAVAVDLWWRRGMEAMETLLQQQLLLLVALLRSRHLFIWE